MFVHQNEENWVKISSKSVSDFPKLKIVGGLETNGAPKSHFLLASVIYFWSYIEHLTHKCFTYYICIERSTADYFVLYHSYPQVNNVNRLIDLFYLFVLFGVWKTFVTSNIYNSINQIWFVSAVVLTEIYFCNDVSSFLIFRSLDSY